jgi:phosphomannomutase
MTINWDSLFKSYDIRGLVGEELNTEVVTVIAAAFVDEFDLAGKSVVIGHDMRESSPEFALAFASGATLRGANAVMLGLCSTDECYFAAGQLDSASAMFTASHNPARYNGIKLGREGSQSISLETGLAAVRDRAARYLEQGFAKHDLPGTSSEHSASVHYAKYLRQLVGLEQIRPIRIVVDAANGMGGRITPLVLGTAAGLSRLPIEVIELYFELDGSFPNHEANPLDPKNLLDLQAAVVANGADLGLAFDGDADRCFVIDELGNPISPSTVAAIVAAREIERVKALGEAQPTVLLSHLTSRKVSELAIANGAIVGRTRVGHSYIKAQMAEVAAVFGAEHSGHYYFRDFWFADSGMLAAMHVIKALGTVNRSMSELALEFRNYPGSGEINLTTEDHLQRVADVEAKFALEEATVERFDGVTISSAASEPNWWWFNLRISNTESLLRLNGEAATAQQLNRVIDCVLAVIQS